MFQTVRVDLPEDGRVSGGGRLGPGEHIQSTLASAYRVELPGIYFGFNSAELDDSSDPIMASLARTLARHPDWKLTIEGTRTESNATIEVEPGTVG